MLDYDQKYRDFQPIYISFERTTVKENYLGIVPKLFVTIIRFISIW